MRCTTSKGVSQASQQEILYDWEYESDWRVDLGLVEIKLLQALLHCLGGQLELDKAYNIIRRDVYRKASILLTAYNKQREPKVSYTND